MEINYLELRRIIANLKKYPKASLLLVTKNRPLYLIKLLIENGHTLFGENRVQEAIEKFSKLSVAFAHGGGSFPYTLGRIEKGFLEVDRVVTEEDMLDSNSQLTWFFE